MNVLKQIGRASFWGMYWSLLAALGLPIAVFYFLDSQNTRMLVAVISIVLLGHSWLMQKRRSQNIWQLLLWTSLLLLPMVGAIWLGLNVIRGNTYEYAADYQRHLGDYRQNLFWYVVETQDWLVWVARVDLVASLLLVATVFMRRRTRAAKNTT